MGESTMSDHPTPSTAFSRPRPFQRVYADEAGPQVSKIQELRTDLQAARAEDDDERVLAILGPLSEAYRLLARLDEASACAEEALELANELEQPMAQISNGLRLATALQYRNEQARALPMFEQTLAKARQRGFLVDYVLQHLGKCLVELGRADEGIEAFEEALALRHKRGDAELVASTEEALEGARERKL
jgi:tetratricopeptide (TPR) repeat protein